MTDFAKGLAAGTIVAPATTSWWPRHSRAMMKYLTLSNTKTPSVQAETAMALQLGAKEWEQMVPKAAQRGIMLDHVKLELALVDAVKSSDVKVIEGLGRSLFQNTTELAAVMGIAIVEFPEEVFKRLLMDHVGSFATAVRKKIEGTAYSPSRMEAVTLQLAALTAEWL